MSNTATFKVCMWVDGGLRVEELGVEPDHRLHRSALVGGGPAAEPGRLQGLPEERLHLA